MKCQSKVTKRPQNFASLPTFEKLHGNYDHESQGPSVTLTTACNKGGAAQTTLS